MEFLSFFQHEFLVFALIGGILSALLCSVLGNFIVAGRQSMISDMLAHTALAGVGIGIFFHVSPSLMAIAAMMVSSVLLLFLLKKFQFSQDALSVFLLTNGLAIALLFSHLAKNNPISFESFLFGSILTITLNELVLLIIASICILGILFFFWKKFLAVIIDSDFSEVKIKNSFLFEILFFLFVAVTVGFSLKIIGGLLIGALLVIPVLTAKAISKSFLQTVLFSVLSSVFSVSLGIFLSYIFDIPTSSAIVLTLTALCVFVYGGKMVKN